MRRFTLAHPHIVVIPAEALDEHGLEPEFAELLITEGRLSAEQIDCLERGTALYWQRCRDLFARAPGSWFPPRQTNLLILSEQRGILPYMEPFIGTSSLLYASDLDTHPEYVAYMLVHVDRLALLSSVRCGARLQPELLVRPRRCEPKRVCQRRSARKTTGCAVFHCTGRCV